jgi:hypothetical protein
MYFKLNLFIRLKESQSKFHFIVKIDSTELCWTSFTVIVILRVHFSEKMERVVSHSFLVWFLLLMLFHVLCSLYHLLYIIVGNCVFDSPKIIK